jgi:hypothetical protein
VTTAGQLETDYGAVTAKTRLGEARPLAVVLDDGRRRLHDAIRRGGWTAGSVLSRALDPLLRRRGRMNTSADAALRGMS